MKKTILTLLWMLVFFIVGSGIYIGIALCMQHLPVAKNWQIEALANSILGWLGIVCMPFLALILGIRGKLPGTRSRKDLLQA
jgi:hypothetical protein